MEWGGGFVLRGAEAQERGERELGDARGQFAFVRRALRGIAGAIGGAIARGAEARDHEGGRRGAGVDPTCLALP